MMDWTYIAREMFTLLCFVSFIIIVIVAYSKSSKRRYDEVANMIVEDNDNPVHTDREVSPHGAKR